MRHKIPNPTKPTKGRVTRRTFLKYSGTLLAGCALSTRPGHAGGTEPKLRIRFGMVTDSHYADRAPKGTRYYQESLAKMRDCVDLMNQEKVAFLIELGDFKDMEEYNASLKEVGKAKEKGQIKDKYALF